MKELSTTEIYWLQEAAMGPFSYIANWPHDKRTHAEDATMQATTYQAMIRYGWVPEEVA